MDEVWERAVETALEGHSDSFSARTLTLDGAVKCAHGRLPPPGLLEKFQNLELLSIANVGVSSLEKFPRLRNLQKLILSDNRIASGLEFLVEAGLDSLRDLDLSNNRIQYLEDLAPLAKLKLISLDLYECPVTRVHDYRSRVFSMIKSLKYLDKMDAEENERPESDEEEDEDEDDEDPGSGEIDGEDRSGKANGGIIDGDEDEDEGEESDEDEEETVRVRANGINGGERARARYSPELNGVDGSDEEEEDVEDEEDDNGGSRVTVPSQSANGDWSEEEEIDEDDDGAEVHEGDDSEEEDGVEEEEEDGDGDDDDGGGDDDDDDDDDDEEEEDVDEEGDLGTAGRLTSAEGEIDGHEQGEEDENGEIGEEDEHGVEEDGDDDEEDGEDEEEDIGAEYLVQPIGQAEAEDEGGASDLDPGENEDDDGEEEEDLDEEEGHRVQSQPPPHQSKRKRSSEDDDDDDDVVENGKSSKQR